jgi:hypothetical protein
VIDILHADVMSVGVRKKSVKVDPRAGDAPTSSVYANLEGQHQRHLNLGHIFHGRQLWCIPRGASQLKYTGNE